MNARVAAFVLVAGGAAVSAGGAVAADCAAEVAALTRAESELPLIEVVSPADRPPYCITLETIMAFAGRLKTHVAQCPASSYAATAADWAKTRADYAKLFTQTKCKRTLLN
jgi:hypothetical protein